MSFTRAAIEESDVAAARPRLSALLASEDYKREADAFLLPYRAQIAALDWERATLSGNALERHEELRPACSRAPQLAAVELARPRYAISLRFNRYLQLTAPRISLEGVVRGTYAYASGELVSGAERISLGVCP